MGRGIELLKRTEEEEEEEERREDLVGVFKYVRKWDENGLHFFTFFYLTVLDDSCLLPFGF